MIIALKLWYRRLDYLLIPVAAILKTGRFRKTYSHCAELLRSLPYYFGDLVKKETGRAAQEYILTIVIDVAIEKMFDLNKAVE